MAFDFDSIIHALVEETLETANAPSTLIVALMEDFRDLGAHFTAGGTLKSTTITRRITSTADAVNRAARLPLSEEKRKQGVQQKFLPKALYACEVQPVPRRPLARLQSAIVDLLGPRVAKRSQNIVFTYSALDGADLDPCVYILVRRVGALRRCYHENPEMRSARCRRDEE